MRLLDTLEKINNDLKGAFENTEYNKVYFSLYGCVTAAAVREINNGKGLKSALKTKQELLSFCISRIKGETFDIKITNGETTLLSSYLSEESPFVVGEKIRVESFIDLCKWIEEVLRKYVKFTSSPVLEIDKMIVDADCDNEKIEGLLTPKEKMNDYVNNYDKRKRNALVRSYMEDSAKRYHMILEHLMETHKEICFGTILEKGSCDAENQEVKMEPIQKAFTFLIMVLSENLPIVHLGIYSKINTDKKKSIQVSTRIMVEQFPAFGGHAVAMRLCTLNMNEITDLSEPVMVMFDDPEEFLEKFQKSINELIAESIAYLRKISSDEIFVNLIHASDKLNLLVE